MNTISWCGTWLGTGTPLPSISIFILASNIWVEVAPRSTENLLRPVMYNSTHYLNHSLQGSLMKIPSFLFIISSNLNEDKLLEIHLIHINGKILHLHMMKLWDMAKVFY
jgi:hypothetical protein